MSAYYFRLITDKCPMCGKIGKFVVHNSKKEKVGLFCIRHAKDTVARLNSGSVFHLEPKKVSP